METEKVSLFGQLERARITAQSAIPPHEFLYRWHGVPCFAKGELVAVTGKAKSGKTYLNSILMAAAGLEQVHASAAGCRRGSLLGLERISEAPMRVVWIDTEQSEDTTCEILRDRIGVMMGEAANEDTFHVFNLRRIPWQERILLVLSAISVCKPDIVIFDGIRDVVGDINNYEEAQKVIGQLLAVASEYRTCIVCVLHQNKAVEDKTLRGALGTELQNKSFETYECTKNPDTRIFTIRQVATRKYDMASRIDFCVDKEGLPMACESSLSEVASTEHLDKGFNSGYVGADGKIDKGRLFRIVLANKSLAWNELRSQIMQKVNIRSPHFAETLMQEARDGGILQTILINGRREYLIQGQQQLFDEVT